ncbi:MAG: hypothetical protein QM500_13955 [Methylococcales bacterium]
MSELLSSVITSGGDFITRTIGDGTIISAGTSGLVLTLTPPAGQRVRITYLSTKVGESRSNVNIAFGGNNIGSIIDIGDGNTGGVSTRTSIGGNPVNSGSSLPFNNYRFMTGGKNESFTLSVTSALAIGQVSYGYEFGE